MMKNECIAKNIYLADDDEDDRMLFEEALSEVCQGSKLTMAINGLELMNILEPPTTLPDVIFLDLNMPTKNGFECLEEIKKDAVLKKLPVIIFSTTAQQEAINKVYKDGASFYICKPDNYNQLKRTIKKVLSIDWLKEQEQPTKEQFIISVA